jgi:hypothetical protein
LHVGVIAATLPWFLLAAEILIIDSSSDRTGEIALAKGVRVLKTPKRAIRPPPLFA